ncbi:INP53, partial [Symbiodinium natans]
MQNSIWLIHGFPRSPLEDSTFQTPPPKRDAHEPSDPSNGFPGVRWLLVEIIVRPIFGLPVSLGALQYFKLAFAAQGPAAALLLAPYLAAPHPPAEVKMAYISVFCPSSYQDAQPLSPSFFFPEARAFREERSVVAHSPPRLPPPLRRSLSSDDSFWPDMGADSSLNALAQAAAAAGVALPETSASVPRLRLDRVQ